MLKYLSPFLLALLLVACSQNGTTTTPTTVTIQDVQNQIKAACNYVPTIESIVAVASTITTAINPAAGTTATILSATGTAVVNEICKAVQTQTASVRLSAKKGDTTPEERTITVTVNGQTVTGTWTPLTGTETK